MDKKLLIEVYDYIHLMDDAYMPGWNEILPEQFTGNYFVRKQDGKNSEMFFEITLKVKKNKKKKGWGIFWTFEEVEEEIKVFKSETEFRFIEIHKYTCGN
jgi:hypothetical protein